jgi:hypothetical protein
MQLKAKKKNKTGVPEDPVDLQVNTIFFDLCSGWKEIIGVR